LDALNTFFCVDIVLDAPPDVTLPPKPTPCSFSSLNVIDNPWDVELLEDIMSRNGRIGVDHQPGKMPPARKGSNLTVGRIEAPSLMETASVLFPIFRYCRSNKE